ncbi:hypothetical protein Q1695_002392 [Nippostrongylus brasiliensis]|nr:hypothetical protein Q1695_002392 [Nippostrongylus brasiliensis]
MFVSLVNFFKTSSQTHHCWASSLELNIIHPSPQSPTPSPSNSERGTFSVDPLLSNADADFSLVLLYHVQRRMTQTVVHEYTTSGTLPTIGTTINSLLSLMSERREEQGLNWMAENTRATRGERSSGDQSPVRYDREEPRPQVDTKSRILY